MCVLRHRSSIISLVFPLADEGSRVRVTVQEREREEEGMARMLEREEWSQQSQTYLRRIAEMETEGEECAEHLEGEIDRLLNKVSNDVCVCVCVCACMCVCVCARARVSAAFIHVHLHLGIWAQVEKATHSPLRLSGPQSALKVWPCSV